MFRGGDAPSTSTGMIGMFRSNPALISSATKSSGLSDDVVPARQLRSASRVLRPRGWRCTFPTAASVIALKSWRDGVDVREYAVRPEPAGEPVERRPAIAFVPSRQ